MLIRIKNNIEEISKMCDKIKAFCSENGIPEEKYHDIVLILDETVTNIINYAYPGGNEQEFILDIEKKNESIFIKLIDSGIPFDPLSLNIPDTDSSIEERQIGGLGIFIVKQLSEAIEYSRVDDKNRLDIVVAICNKEKEKENGN
ncbi:MAG: ATP-binding protein [Holosporaceae bacterium]|jgi:anti-sigma regulatory factor (Ser/Thr protein kinase)|nr:ATP-binding protein [Holosporaceae bacterium]